MSSVVKFPRELMKTLSKRTFAQDQCKSKKSTMFVLKKLAFNLSGFNKYGLYAHDVIDYSNPVVCEALRRLPKDVLDARNFRIIRAVQLSLLRTYLSREKWVTYEQDLEYRYLGPYMKEIEAEKAEIREFGCLNYSDMDWPAGEVK